MNRRYFLQSGAMFGAITLLGRSVIVSAIAQSKGKSQAKGAPFNKVVKSNEEWKRILTPEQYFITRQAGTEAPYTSPLLNIHEDGTFACVCCDLPLFSSKTKFESNTGWPSFWQPLAEENIVEHVDSSYGMTRTSVSCRRCDAHLGHVFEDGPKPTGLRYCMNGLALKFLSA